MGPDEARLERSPDALHRSIEGKAVILHAGTGTYFTLNAVGSRVWALLEGGSTRARLVGALLAELDVAPEVLERDVSAFLDELTSAGLVRTGA